MEQQIKLPIAQSTLDSLNEYYLLDIFERLKLDDLMNVAETCTKFKQVVRRIFEKGTQFELDQKIVKKGEKYIDRVLFHIGRDISSLTIDCYDKYPCSSLMNRIDWRKLKYLRIVTLSEACQNVLFVPECLYSCSNVELLTLSYCNFLFPTTFLQTFNKLKYFNSLYCNIELDDFRIVFQSNPDIESFVFGSSDDDKEFNCQLLELIPKVDKLAVDVAGRGFVSSLNSLLTLNQLTKVRLDCRQENINNFLGDLSRKGILKELELHWVKFDNNSMNILKTFDQLELLSLHNAVGPGDSTYAPLDSSTVFPPKLKRLRMFNIEISYDTFFSAIRQLKCLESFDVSLITLTECSRFEDVTKLFQQIIEAKDINEGKQRLDVVLPWYFDFDFGKDPSGKRRWFIESDRLRILQEEEDKYNELGIRILFPDINRKELYCLCMEGE